jgi:hypothetical protein
LADTEAIADGLNPFTISHIERITSAAAIGSQKRGSNPKSENPASMSILSRTEEINKTMAATKPQIDINRGTSLDLYNAVYKINDPKAKTIR